MGSSRENTGPPCDDAETIDTGTVYGDDMEYAYQDVVVPMVDGFVVQPIEATKVDNELPCVSRKLPSLTTATHPTHRRFTQSLFSHYSVTTQALLETT